MLKHLNNKKGFTLIELLVVIAILAIIMAPIGTFLVSNIRTFYQADDQIEAQDKAQRAANTIMDRAIAAKSAKITDSGTLKLELEIDASNKWIFEYDRSLDTLYINTSSDSTDMVVLTDSITAFEASFPIDKEDAITLYVESIVGNSVITVKNMVYLRNYSD